MSCHATLWAGGLRIVSDESYMGLGKNLLFTEFTSIPDWHYEAPNFWAFYGAFCSDLRWRVCVALNRAMAGFM